MILQNEFRYFKIIKKFTDIMLSGIADFILHPNVFFSKPRGRMKDFIGPLLIWMTPCFIFFIQISWGNPFMTVHIWMKMAPFIFAMIPFLIWSWICLSILVFIVPYFVSRQGSFVATIQNTAYGMVPLLIVVSIDRLRQPISPVVAVNMAFFNGGIFESAILVLFFIGTIWSGYLLAIATSKNHHLSMVQACFIVGAIFALIFSWDVDMFVKHVSQWL